MTDLAVPDQQTDLEPAEARQMNALWKYAQRFANSTLVPKELQGQPESVMLILSHGQALGLAPAHALTGLWIINGRVEPSAQVRVGVVMAHGHEVICEETSSEQCTIAVRRRGGETWQRITYTADDAARAGALDEWVERWSKTQNGRNYKETYVVQCRCGRHEGIPEPQWATQERERGNVKRKDPWFSYRDDMLYAAAARRATKRFTPDAFLNIDLPTGGEVIDHPADYETGEVHADHGAVEGPEPEPDIADAEIVEPASEPAPEAEAATEAGTAPAPVQSPPEPFPDTEPLAGGAFSRGFAIACTEAGIEDDGRHALIAYATGGRTRTSKEVRRGQEAAACFAALERVKAETLTFTTGAEGELVVEDKEAQG